MIRIDPPFVLSRRLLFVIAVGFLFFGVNDSKSVEPAVAPDASSNESLEVGLRGVYRPGQWTMVKPPPGVSGKASIQTLDGDGANVVYEQSVAPDARVMYAVAGRPGVPLVIRDKDGNELHRGRFTGESIEPKMPWVVVFGDTLGIETIGRNELLNRESSVAVSQIDRAEQFPDQVVGLAGVDLIVIGPSSANSLSGLSTRQGESIVTWVNRGGRVLISLGSNCEPLLVAAPWLRKLVSIDDPPKAIRLDPSSIETYTSSQNRLPTLDSIELPALGGETIISGRNLSRQPTRVAIQSIVGFGRVVVTSFALDSPELTSWPERTLLVSRLSGKLFASENEIRRDVRSRSSVGYDDLAGQIRMSLDRFDSKRRVPFSIISVILIGLVALIGPIDYLIVNRVLGKPLLGWITFPLSVFIVSAILVAIGRPDHNSTVAGESPSHALSKVSSVAAINRMEIVDIDTVGKTPLGRGWLWSHIYSFDSTITNYPATLAKEIIADGSKPAITSAPFGYPGSTFGGISIAGEDTRLPMYRVMMSSHPTSGVVSDIFDIPLAPGGSKGLMTRWAFAPRLSGESDLSRRRGSELLEGRLTNSLSVDILNGALVFGEWVYLLPTRFKAGQTIDNIDTLRQKNFRWLLARREALENSSRSEPWDPEMYADMPRLAEILMFESVVGGQDYTGLSNRPLQDLDLSYLLKQDRAILFGQLESFALQVDIPVQRASVSAVRVIVPVSAPRLLRTESL